ncbi:MAG: hypothetical protein PVI60_03865 [Desulfobacteraceae bacterium]
MQSGSSCGVKTKSVLQAIGAFMVNTLLGYKRSTAAMAKWGLDRLIKVRAPGAQIVRHQSAKAVEFARTRMGGSILRPLPVIHLLAM